MIHIIIIVVTAVISYLAFENPEIKNKYMFNAHAIKHNNEWVRFISHGFLHADWTHLIFNMLSLFFFGGWVANMLGSPLIFILFYLSAIVVSSLYSYYQNQENKWYNSLGASGAVSAVVFASILFDPWNTIYLYFIPVPAILFGGAYLWYSSYMSKQNTDNIGHDAHFTGAIYGFFFPLLIDFDFLWNFLYQVFPFLK